MKPYDNSLIDFLGRGSGFIVPPFQRRYEWSKDQCEILFNDISKTADINSVPGHELTKSIHFFGTFIVSSDGESPFIIADGQQRIITSMLFLAACMHSPYCPEELKGEIQKILFSGTNPRLQQNKLDQGTYTKIIQGKALSLQEEKNDLWKNYKYFTERISQGCCSRTDLESLLREGLKNFQVIVLTFSPTEENLQEVFESINSTGQPLLLSDLIRNYLLMGLPPKKQEEYLERCWGPIEEKLSEGQKRGQSLVSEFICDYMQSKMCEYCSRPSPSKNQELYYKFKSKFRVSGEKESIIEMEGLERAAGLYASILSLGSSGNSKIDQIFQDLNTIDASSARSFLLALLSAREEGSFTDEDVLEILKPLEFYFLRRRLCGLSGSENKTFPSLAEKIHNLAKSENKGLEMYEILCGLEESARFPDDEELTANLCTENFYQSPKKQKLFQVLFELIYETQSNHRLPKPSRSDLQIEHIMPQTLNPTWKRELGADAESIRRQWVNNIGNLTLISKNPEASNKSFNEKKEIYRTQPAIATDPLVMDSEYWDAESIRKRQDVLVAQTLRTLPLPKQFQGQAGSSAITLESSLPSADSKAEKFANSSFPSPAPTPTGADRKGGRLKPNLKDLVYAGLLHPGDQITATSSKRGSSACGTVNVDGSIFISGRGSYRTPTAAYNAVRDILGRPSNDDGWRKWKTEDGRTLGEIWEQYRKINFGQL